VTVPSELIAGDTWAWTLTYADYPAGTWTATIYFENRFQTFSATGSASGTNHAFSISAVTSSAYKSGRYKWRVRVTNGSTVTTVDSGESEVLFDPAAAGSRDTRSTARRTLEALEAFLEGYASTAQQAMTVGGRSISRWSPSELRQWQIQLRADVRREEQADQAGVGRNIKVRYGRS
jgi:hypothetical protein